MLTNRYSKHLLVVAALVLAPALGSRGPLFADSLTVSGASGVSGPVQPAQPCSNNGATASSGSLTMTCPSYTVEGATFGFIATGDLSTGTFGVSASIAYSGPPITLGEGAGSVTVVEPDYLFSSTIQTGTADFSIATLGDLTCLSCVEGDAVIKPTPGETITLTGGSTGTILPPNGNLLLASGNTTFTIAAPITDGTAELNFQLDALLVCNISCTNTVDFLDPTTITGVTVYDSNGDLVPDATLISQSGFNPNAVSTPEPSSLLLLGLGLIVLFACITRFSRRSPALF